MRLVREVDENGRFVKDVAHVDSYTDGVLDELPNNLVEEAVSGGLLQPYYIGGKWVEGAAQELLDKHGAVIASAGLAADARKLKSEGKRYLSTGITVPFRSADAMAVLQVKAAFEVGVTSTNIKLSNGQILPMNAADFTAFATWFASERNQFFLT